MTVAHNGLSDVKIRYLNQFVKAPTILDLGAGNCKYSAWVKLMLPEAEVVAVDRASCNPPEEITFRCLDVEQRLPFEDASFETVIAFDILEHVSDTQHFLSEILRVLKPGGILLGSVPHDDDHFLPAYNLTFYHRTDVTHKRYYIPKTLLDTLQGHDFIGVKTWLEGGVSPAVFAEFFPGWMKPLVKKTIGLCRRIGVIKADILKSDLFFVAYKYNLKKS